MKPFRTLTALAAPLHRHHVDTDTIIPKQFLRGIRRDLSRWAFFDWRYLEGDESQENPAFTLNQPRYRGAKILVTGENFGCGSSREQAPWALVDSGLRCIIAGSFADIFYNNCIKNGLLPIRLQAAELAELKAAVEGEQPIQITIDLAAQTLQATNGFRQSFDIAPTDKTMLLEGLDDIALTQTSAAKIKAFEKTHQERFPWLML